LAPRIGESAAAAVDLLMLVALTPFVTFYLVRDWHVILHRTKLLVPPRLEPTAVLLAARIDRRLSGFIRGQTLICVLQGAWHIVGYSLIGLHGAMLIGLAMGISNYIPFIGNAIVFIVALGVAATQFDALWPIAVVVGLYASSQIIEDGILYPAAVVGDRIKLHPVWLIIVLLAAAGLFGLTGALLAIPITCVLEVLIAHAAEMYRQTSFYKDP
jgi:predicted PurR-regulated permease PerM